MNAFNKAIETEFANDFKLGIPLRDPVLINRRLTAMSNLTNGKGFRVPPQEPKKNAQGLTRGARKRIAREKANEKARVN